MLKGKGIITRILTILEGIPFGPFYFEVAMMLRNSLLVSSMLVNTEAWYKITKAELNLLFILTKTIPNRLDRLWSYLLVCMHLSILNIH